MPGDTIQEGHFTIPRNGRYSSKGRRRILSYLPRISPLGENRNAEFAGLRILLCSGLNLSNPEDPISRKAPDPPAGRQSVPPRVFAWGIVPGPGDEGPTIRSSGPSCATSWVNRRYTPKT